MKVAMDSPVCSEGPLGRMDPRWKLACVLPAAVVAALLVKPASVLAALVGALVLVALARLPWRWCLARLGGVMLFLGFFALWLPFFPAPGEEYVSLWGIVVSPIGLERAAVLFGKGLTLVSLMLVLFGTAPLPDTLKAAHALRVPGLLTHLVLLTYRYLFLLADEFLRLRNALRVRGFRNRANLHSYRTIGQVAGTLLVRGHERGERVAHAMRCRGFDGQFRSLCEFRTRKRDLIGFTLIVGGTLVISALDLALRWLI